MYVSLATIKLSIKRTSFCNSQPTFTAQNVSLGLLLRHYLLTTCTSLEISLHGDISEPTNLYVHIMICLSCILSC